MHKLLQQLRERYARLRKPHEPAEAIDEALRAKQIATLAVTLALILGFIFWWLPRYQIRHTPGITGEKLFDDENEARKTLAQIFGGSILILGFYFSAKTYGLSHEGHITDRFTKAIEQLGKMENDKPNIEVRLGAIYALERIAIDSPRDHWIIMEIFTTYVRQNAPLDSDRPYVKGEKPRPEIQAILTVLGRRRTGPKRERPGQRLDLAKSRLCGANLRKANLQEADLSQANLQEAFLGQVNLQETSLKEANLQEAYLWDARLQVAGLERANLQKAYLKDAHLQEADLRNANLQEANLWNANVQEANLNEANLRKADGLTVDQIKSAQHWGDAHYFPAFRAELGLPPEDEDPPQ